jgi:hypothetical protein
MPLVYAGPATVELPRDSRHEHARKIRPEFTRGPLVRVGWGRNQAEAELMQNLLIEEGVPSILRRSAGADVPDFLAAGPRDVLVPESGAEAARDALHQADIEPSRPIPSERASGQHVARIVTAVLAGAGLAALIAWAMVQAVK